MILVDFAQSVIATVFAEDTTDELVVERKVFEALKGYKNRFSEYGDMVICCDGKDLWRKKEFIYYKANRKAHKKESKHDWVLIYGLIKKITEALKEYSPYKVIYLKEAEADDIIATLVRYVNLENSIIISTDKDFMQLQTYDSVSQYCPRTKQFMVIDNPKHYLMEKIIRGDQSDGIPNIKSPDNSFLIEKRQKSILSKNLVNWVNMKPEEFCDDEMLKKFERNKMLMDFEYIPSDLSISIMKEFNNAKVSKRTDLMNYFMSRRQKELVEQIGEF